MSEVLIALAAWAGYLFNVVLFTAVIRAIRRYSGADGDDWSWEFAGFIWPLFLFCIFLIGVVALGVKVGDWVHDRRPADQEPQR